MRAAIYPGGGGAISIETLPDPEPGPGEVLIRVHRCGICGTDLSMTRGQAWDYGANAQFGHEYAGEIVALGKGVERLKVGQRIAVNPSGACGHCEGCAGGNHVLCREPGASKGFAELALVPAYLAVPLPDTLSMADGALIEPLAVSRYGVTQSPLAPGDAVVVLGGGSVALNTIWWARRLGAGRIVALSRSARRRALCLAMGADAFVQFGPDEVGDAREALDGAPKVVFECAGTGGMLAKAVSHAGLYGHVVSLGFCTAPDPVMPALAAYKGLTMQFRVGYTMADFFESAAALDAGGIDPGQTITRTAALAELPAMFSLLRGANDETKVHIAPVMPPAASLTAGQGSGSNPRRKDFT